MSHHNFSVPHLQDSHTPPLTDSIYKYCNKSSRKWWGCFLRVTLTNKAVRPCMLQRVYLCCNVWYTYLFVLPAKQGLKWKLSKNVACIVSLKNRCHYESVPNLVKMDFPIHVLVFSFHFEVMPCSLISHDYWRHASFLSTSCDESSTAKSTWIQYWSVTSRKFYF